MCDIQNRFFIQSKYPHLNTQFNILLYMLSVVIDITEHS